LNPQGTLYPSSALELLGEVYHEGDDENGTEESADEEQESVGAGFFGRVEPFGGFCVVPVGFGLRWDRHRTRVCYGLFSREGLWVLLWGVLVHFGTFRGM